MDKHILQDVLAKSSDAWEARSSRTFRRPTGQRAAQLSGAGRRRSYQSHRLDQAPLMLCICDLAATRTRCGYFRFYILLRRSPLHKRWEPRQGLYRSTMNDTSLTISMSRY